MSEITSAEDLENTLAIGRELTTLRARVAELEAEVERLRTTGRAIAKAADGHRAQERRLDTRVAELEAALKPALEELESYREDCNEYEAPEELGHLDKVIDQIRRLRIAPKPMASVIEEQVPERERCARHCEVLAHFLENGAGPLNAPSARLRQAAENIRSGKPASLWLASYREDPDFSVPVPKCGHGAQSWTIGCETCGAMPTGSTVMCPNDSDT